MADDEEKFILWRHHLDWFHFKVVIAIVFEQVLFCSARLLKEDRVLSLEKSPTGFSVQNETLLHVFNTSHKFVEASQQSV